MYMWLFGKQLLFSVLNITLIIVGYEVCEFAGLRAPELVIIMAVVLAATQTVQYWADDRDRAYWDNAHENHTLPA